MQPMPKANTLREIHQQNYQLKQQADAMRRRAVQLNDLKLKQIQNEQLVIRVRLQISQNAQFKANKSSVGQATQAEQKQVQSSSRTQVIVFGKKVDLPKEVNPTYAEGKKITQGQGLKSTYQAHHILPKEYGKMLGYTTKDMDSHPSIVLPQVKHTGKGNERNIHAIIQQHLPRNDVTNKRIIYTHKEIMAGLKKSYEEYGQPELYNMIKDIKPVNEV